MSRTIKRWKFWPGSSTNYSTLYPPNIDHQDAQFVWPRREFFDRKARVWRELPMAEQIALMHQRLARYYFKTKRGRNSVPSHYSRIYNRKWTMAAKLAMVRGLTNDEEREVVLPRLVRNAGWYWW